MNELERMVLQTIGGYIDEVTLCGDPDSFVEMEQQVIHVASTKFGEHYFKVTLTSTTEDQYFKFPTA